jgi:hypothetical protein
MVLELCDLEYSEGDLEVLLVRGPEGIVSLVTRRSTPRSTPRCYVRVGPHPRILCHADGPHVWVDALSLVPSGLSCGRCTP